MPTEQMQAHLAVAISAAWLANRERIYPDGAEMPDPKALAEVAASAAAGLFCGWIAAARGRKERD